MGLLLSSSLITDFLIVTARDCVPQLPASQESSAGR